MLGKCLMCNYFVTIGNYHYYSSSSSPYSDLRYLMSFQEESRILKVKVVAGIGLAKKDILGAR